MSTDALKEVRRLQREGRALKKRFLGKQHNTELIAIRDAVDYANMSGWNNPTKYPGHPAVQAKVNARWADNWLALYKTRLAALLASTSP